MINVALCGGTVIDGLGSVQALATVLIENGKIKEVICGNICPEGFQKIDMSGKYIMPGLIEMHGHFFGRAGTEIKNLHEQYCTLYLAGGVTTVRSAGERDPYTILAYKNKIEHGEAIGPKIVYSGSYFDRLPSIVSWIDASSSLDALIAKYAIWYDKIDQIKIYSNVTAEWLEVIAKAAHNAGLKVYGHLGAVTVKDAIHAGINGYEHGLYNTPDFYDKECKKGGFDRLMSADPDSLQATELIKLIVENDVAVTPTIAILHTSGQEITEKINRLNLWRYFSDDCIEIQRESRQLRDSNPEEIEKQNNFLIKQYRFTNRIYEAGGKVFCGTDPVYPMVMPGYALVWEAENLTKCGMSNGDIIKALTSNAAKELDIFSKTGSIEAGKDADIAVFCKNPLENVSNLEEIDAVYKSGIYYNPEELRKSTEGKIK